MILKILGSLLLVSACFVTGCIKSKALYRRREFLENLLVFISLLETNLRFSGSDIFTLISASANSDDLRYLIVDSSQTDKAFSELWNANVSELPNSLALKGEDKKLLTDFGSELGKSDLEGQIKHLQLYQSMFQRQLLSAQNEIAKKSKLYKIMGLFVGVSVALVMI